LPDLSATYAQKKKNPLGILGKVLKTKTKSETLKNNDFFNSCQNDGVLFYRIADERIT